MVFFTRRFLPVVGTSIGNLDVGTEITLNENGEPINYLIVNQGIPEDSALYDASCDGTWLLRKDIRENGQWNASNVNTLAGSTIMSTMAGYLTDYDANVQEAIKTVKIPYCVGGGNTAIMSGANGLECKIFPLGGYEIGLSQSSVNTYVPIDGAKLDYFDSGVGTVANNKRIAKLNGTNRNWHLRSVVLNPSAPNTTWIISSNGDLFSSSASAENGIRPTLILPFNFKLDDSQIVA